MLLINLVIDENMATTVIIQELDSAVLEGIRLLHSKDPDSLEQLKHLWKQAVREKYGTEREPVSVLNKITVPSGLKRENTHEIGDDFAFEPKKSKLESSTSIFHKSAPASPQSGTANVFGYVADDVEVNVSSSDEDSDYNDSPLEILNSDGICVKCKSSSSNHNNKLVECVDCHKHYHQQCHFPPITDMDLSDPRFVWYCSSCEQNITTTTTSDKSKTSSNSSLSVSKPPLSSSKTLASSSVSKSSRSYGAPSHTSRSTISSSSGSSNKLSSNSSPKHASSSSSDKKSHLLKKKPLKKHDKRKSAK